MLQARTVFNQPFLKDTLLQFWSFNLLLLATAMSVFKVKHFSKYLFVAVVGAASGITIFNLFDHFSKLITISLFLYLITSYYFYQFLKIEIDEAYYNPSFSEDDLFEPMLTKLNCEVRDTNTGNVYQARLTNWNPNGCFVYLENPVEDIDFKNAQITTSLSETSFNSVAVLACRTQDKKGFGFRVPSTKGDFGWREYYSILDQMGFNVELLR
ncbi:MAG: hypothetical protein CME64_07210 [Halobacteriovoraceae bacterium]|nr:hypothetical protein [Halobacteriovoraceae bacterium]